MSWVLDATRMPIEANRTPSTNPAPVVNRRAMRWPAGAKAAPPVAWCLRSAYYPFLLPVVLPFNLADFCLGGTAFMSAIGRKENGMP